MFCRVLNFCLACLFSFFLHLIDKTQGGGGKGKDVGGGLCGCALLVFSVPATQ